MSQSKWTHAICELDYEGITGRSLDTATKLIEPDPEICCFCNAVSFSGLYVRFDPDLLKFCKHGFFDVETNENSVR